MGKIILMLAAVILSGCAHSVCRVRVLKYPGEPVGNKYDSMDIRIVRAAYNCDSVVVRLQDRRKLILDPNMVWGFQDTDSSLWRFSGRRFISVCQLDTPSIYSFHHSLGRSSHTHYLFSKTPVSPVYDLSWRNIRRQYSDKPCFISQLKPLHIFRSFESYDRKKKQYRIVKLYKKCSSVETP